MRPLSLLARHGRTFFFSAALAASLASVGCAGRQATLTTDALPLRRVVLYRNGVGYFERSGQVEGDEVRFRMKATEVGDFLATLAVMERGGSSVRSAAFPLKMDDDNEEAKRPKTEEEKRGLKQVVLALDGRSHELQVGYVAETPVWRPSYRLVVRADGHADLQSWGIVQNLSGEDWREVRLVLVSGAPLAFEAQLATPVIPQRPVVLDSGEVIAAVPRSETSLAQEPPKPLGQPAAPPAEPVAGDEESELDDSVADTKKKDRADRAPRGRALGASGKGASLRREAPAPKKPGSPSMYPAAPPPPPPPPALASITLGGVPSQPRNLRSLAAVAAEGGTTRYDIPTPITVPDKSSTMVMLLAREVPGEAAFLFAPDGGVPDSSSHPFRVARFTNSTGGMLEKGPIAVFEAGSFLGQGLLDPLPDGAVAAVPFALERSIAVAQERKYDELGERVAKIENGELFIERDGVTLTKYKLRNGGEKPAKALVKHPRMHGTRLQDPPKATEDNVGTQSALVPTLLAPHATAELVVDERSTLRRHEEWVSPVADNAVKAYLGSAKSDAKVVSQLRAAWALRAEIVQRQDAQSKLVRERSELSTASEETRRNLRAIEKNAGAAQLRGRLTARLTELSTRYDEVAKRVVEVDEKLAELRIQFREAVREIKLLPPPSPAP